MGRRKEDTPEDLAKAQHLYEKTLTPVDDIAAMLGVSRSTFSKRAGNWQRRSARAKEAAEEVRAVYDEKFPDDPAAVLCVAWGIVVPNSGGPRSETVIIGYY
jgi:hypothetical protein